MREVDMLRRLGIRSKVLAVLAVPMIVLLGAIGFIGYGSLRDSQTADAVNGVVKAMNAYAPVVAALETERTVSVKNPLGLPKDPAAVVTARAATDAALRNLEPLVKVIAFNEFSPAVSKAFAESTFQHANISEVRRLVDVNAEDAVLSRNFNTAVDTDLALASLVADAIPDRALASYLVAYGAIENTNEALILEKEIGQTILTEHGSSPVTIQLFVTQISTTEFDRSEAAQAVTNLGDVSLYLSTADPTFEFNRKRGLLQTGNANAVSTINPGEWTKDISDQITRMSGVRDQISQVASAAAAKSASSARTQALSTAGLGILAFLVSLLVAIVVSRGIIYPLRRLTEAAGALRELLPTLVEQVSVPGEGPDLTLAQIPVESRDEVGRLATAFNAVNATTMQVAQEQAALRGSIAAMFINVARRDQVLLNRQLSFIDSLERTEEDPNALANLFRLDHLATRMRRNAESLLVLAGIDSGRRMRDSMPLSDVIRTASSEIEQYDRIQLELPVDPHMLGFNALSSAHLLAELMENATIFSEPETAVEVKTGMRGEYVVVTVVDHGLGIADEDLITANEKIRSTAASDSLGAQRLGLFVVGRLAQRLGAKVELRKGEGGSGTITEVLFPITLFQATESSLMGYTPPEISAEAPAAVPVAPSIEQAAAAWLAPPVIEEVVPVVEAVDVAALTDGTTTLGLPKRRLREDEHHESTAPVTQEELRERDESKMVLPSPIDARLSPEISGTVAGWIPDVAAPSTTNLPARSRAASTFWQEPAAEEEVVAAPAAAPIVRAGMFSGFRRGAGLPSPAPGDVSAPEVVKAVEPFDGEHRTAEYHAAEHHAARYHDPDGTIHADPVEASAYTAPTPVPTPRLGDLPFVIPGLVSDDDEDDVVYRPGRDWQPTVPVVPKTPAAAAPVVPAPVVRMPVAWTPVAPVPVAPAPAAPVPVAPVPVAQVPVAPVPVAVVPVAPVPVVVVPDAPAPVVPAWVEPAAEIESESEWAPVLAWEAPGSMAVPTDLVRGASEDHIQVPSWTPLAQRTAPAPVEEPQAPTVPTPKLPDLSSYGFEPHLDEARAWGAVEPLAPVTEPVSAAPESADLVAEPLGAAPESADLVAEPLGAAPESADLVAEPLGTVPESADLVVEPVGTVPEFADPVVEPVSAAPESADLAVEPVSAAPESADPVVEPVSAAPESAGPVTGATSWFGPRGGLPSRVASEPIVPIEPAAPIAPAVGQSALWSPAPAPTGFPVFSPEPEAPAAVFVPMEATPQARPTEVIADSWAQQVLPAAVVAETWAPAAQAPAIEPEPAFHQLMSGVVAPADEPKRRRGLFGRKKDKPAPTPQPPAQPSQVFATGFQTHFPAPPATESAPNGFAGARVPDPPQGLPAENGHRPASFSAPSPAAPMPQRTFVPSAPPPTPVAAVFTPEPIREVRPATSWSPPVSASSNGNPQGGGLSKGSAPSRVGALDDEVAAMLALRSDIQEQALAELSQLSAYRPTGIGSNGSGTSSLTRRVPTAIPEAPEFVQPEGDRSSNRDAAQLRSRLSSFQSGTSRGRRAVEEGGEASPSDVSDNTTSPMSYPHESLSSDDHDNTASAPSW
jgi:signal transduction histidine kinase